MAPNMLLTLASSGCDQVGKVRYARLHQRWKDLHVGGLLHLARADQPGWELAIFFTCPFGVMLHVVGASHIGNHQTTMRIKHGGSTTCTSEVDLPNVSQSTLGAGETWVASFPLLSQLLAHSYFDTIALGGEIRMLLAEYHELTIEN